MMLASSKSGGFKWHKRIAENVYHHAKPIPNQLLNRVVSSYLVLSAKESILLTINISIFASDALVFNVFFANFAA